MRFRRLLVVSIALLLSWSSPTEGDGVLFFSEVFEPTFGDGTINRINTDGTGLVTIVNVGGGLRGVAVDASAGKLYWTDVGGNVIRRANLDGSESEDLVTAGLGFPNSIDLDPADNSFYWGDQGLNQIARADLDGSNPDVVLTTLFHWGSRVEASTGKLYWSTSVTAATGDIMRSNVDGTNVETVVTRVDKPADIAVDVAGGKIYWTDFAVNVVRRANIDGTDVEDLFVAIGNLDPLGIALDLTEGKVYWAQMFDARLPNRMNIMRMNLDGSDQEVIAYNFGAIVEIDFVPEFVSTVALDIKPGSCPNSFNRNSNGVLPVGLLGSEDFDITLVDVASILLARADGVGGFVAPHEGPPGPRSRFADVGTPFEGDPCDCLELEGDGLLDLSMHFDSPELVETLELDGLPRGSSVELVVHGTLLDGVEFVASDCIRLVGP